MPLASRRQLLIVGILLFIKICILVERSLFILFNICFFFFVLFCFFITNKYRQEFALAVMKKETPQLFAANI